MSEKEKRSERSASLSYPAYILIAEKPCLVIGGGRVAQRKVEKLLSCGADVTVISENVTAKLKKLADDGKIQFHERKVDLADIQESYSLIFTTTDDFSLNKHITEECNRKRIPVCAVDANWVNGHFITPASFSKDGMTVAVATGGRSCRRSKLIKENIHRHFKALELSELIVVGIDHSTLSLEQQAPFHPGSKDQKLIAEMLNGISAVHEFFILNTCNRFEIIALAHTSRPAVETIKKIMGFDKLSDKEYYIKTAYEAFEHTSLMLSGVLSQNVGENYIVSQVKEALKDAKKNKLADGIVQDWIDKSLHISKKIRNTLFLSPRKEIDGLVAEYIESHTEDIAEKSAAVLGTGKIGNAVYEKIKGIGFKNTIVFYRSRKPSINGDNIRCKPLTELKDKINKIDVLVSALNAPEPIITSDMTDNIAEQPLFIDLGTPANIAELSNQNIKVINLTDIQTTMNQENREKIKQKAAELIRNQRELFDKIMDTLK